MSYHLDNNSYSQYGSKRPRRIRVGWLLVLALVLMALGGWLFGFFEPLVASVNRPFWQGREVAGNAAALGSMLSKTKSQLAQENQSLKAQLATFEAVVLVRDRLTQENQELRELMGRTSEESKPVVVKVLTRPDQSPYDIVVVDAGRQTTEQIEVGDRVMLEGILLGYVADVGNKTSKVRLLSSPGVTTPVAINGSTTIQAQAEGMGAGNFRIALPRGADMAVGSIVSHASSSNALIGRVATINNQPDEAFQLLYFRSPISLFSVRWLEIYAY